MLRILLVSSLISKGFVCPTVFVDSHVFPAVSLALLGWSLMDGAPVHQLRSTHLPQDACSLWAPFYRLLCVSTQSQLLSTHHDQAWSNDNPSMGLLWLDVRMLSWASCHSYWLGNVYNQYDGSSVNTRCRRHVLGACCLRSSLLKEAHPEGYMPPPRTGLGTRLRGSAGEAVV